MMRLVPPRRPFLLTVLAATVLLAACDSGEPGTETPPPPDGGDEIIAGVNLTALFQPPSPAEEAAVQAEWAARDQGLDARYAFELAAERTASDGADLLVYRATSASGGPVLFHGVVRLPPRPPGDVRQRPLLLVLPDGEDGASAALFTNGALPLFPDDRDDLILALPAYRGTPLEVAGESFTSAAPPSPYDLDPDDALAFLHFVQNLNLEVPIDRGHVGVLGLGRGGGTALLTAARTPLYDLVVDLAGPTDLFLLPFRNHVRLLLQDRNPGAFPGFDTLAEEILYPLRDGTLSVEQARFELLLRSPRYFIAPPPFFLVAHGTLDYVVSIEHSQVLDLSTPDPDGETTSVFLAVEEYDHGNLAQAGQVLSLVSAKLHERLDL